MEDFQRAVNSDECSVEQEPAGYKRWGFRTPWGGGGGTVSSPGKFDGMYGVSSRGVSGGPLSPRYRWTGQSPPVLTGVCCAVGSFLSSGAYKHPSVILYSNKTMREEKASRSSPSLLGGNSPQAIRGTVEVNALPGAGSLAPNCSAEVFR